MTDDAGRAPGPDGADAGDPLVTAALRHLPVPDHGPGFWDGLDALLGQDPPVSGADPGGAAVPDAPSPGTAPWAGPPLAAEPVLAPPALPDDHRPAPEPSVDPIRLVPVPSVLPSGMRRRSTAALATLAVAAVTVVALATVTMVNRDPDGVDTAASPDPGEQDPAAIGAPEASAIGRFTGTIAAPALGYHGGGEAGRPAGGIEAIAPAEVPGSGEEAAAAFVLAVDRGDIEAAWHLLAPRSQEFWAAKERFAAARSELAEGRFGAFGVVRGLEVSTLVLQTGEGGELGVVTLDGVVAHEGDERRRALDLPYRFDPATGAWLVDPWSGADTSGHWGEAGSPIVFRHPAPVERGFAPLGASDAVEVRVPAWATDVTVLVDGLPVVPVSPDAAGTVRVQPPDPFAPGVHRLTVTAVGDDGTLAAASMLVLVP